MKKGLVLAVALLLVAGYSTGVMAFHDEGVARCSGCHTMHNSQDGALVDADSAAGNAFLMKDATPSDTCLSCHAGYGQLGDGTGAAPGGDFYWTTTDVSWSGYGGTTTVEGREHGHNQDAPGHGLVEDSVLTTAPGGSYDSSYLGCNSCHDPHGNENFRLLYGAGDTGANYPGGYSFGEAAPIADGNSRRTTAGSSGEELIGQHTAYISGMSDWCANCHQDMHSGMTSNLVHPVGNLGSTVSGNYNAYVTSNDVTGGAYATAYLPLVPIEDSANATDSTTGSTASSQVMCLTCHRAHASPFADAGRWDFGASPFLEEAHPAPGDEPYITKYDGAPLDLAVQRSLCNKCHVQDADDYMPVATP